MSEHARESREVFVGPRPFERSEKGLFFGREREISEMLSLVISSRVVLCYAPSGAGKTSLVNAGLYPRLEQEGFEILPSSRVRGLIPEGINQAKIPNLYIFNALLSLAGKGGTPGELTGCSLADFLSSRPHLEDEEGFPSPRVLVFDQFEELLTSYPERWQERDGFFQQVRDALQADTFLRVVFVMREDFLARIEPYVRLLKPFQQARFHLDLLGPDGAHSAVTGPLRETGKRFKEGVAEALIEELRKVRVETAQGQPVEVVGEYVEPVQLQVVCRNLWTSLPAHVQEINTEHLKAYGDVDHALRDFYESCLAEAKASLGADELALRGWFEGQLITPAGTRGIVFRDAKRTANLPNPIVDFLENRHLIRGEWRAGSRWYELTHDRFIEPIQQANERWRGIRRARRNRWVMAMGGMLILGIILSAVYFSARQTASQAEGVRTALAVQATSFVLEGQATQANEDAAFSKSRQLAAEALLATDPDLALLLAVEANKQANTQEARRSLHKILSRQTGIDDKFLSEFDPKIVSPKLVKRLQGHKNWVHSVAFSPDGRQIVSGSRDTTLLVWDVSTGEQVGSPLSGHGSEVWSVAYSPIDDLIASAGLDGKILLWSASKRELIDPPLFAQSAWITSVAFSPDGKYLASGDGNGIIRIWNVSTRELLADEEAHKGIIWSLAWSPDGRFLASGSADSTIVLWDAVTLSKVRLLSGQRGQVWSLAWSSDGRRLASGSVLETGIQTTGEVILWDSETGKTIARPILEDAQPVRAVAFDPGGTILAIGWGNGAITLWDAQSAQIQGKTLRGHDNPVMSLAFSPDGKYMVSGSIDRSIALWDLSVPTRSIAFSPRYDALAASAGPVIMVWDPADKILPVAKFTEHTGEVLALEFNPDGSTLASAGQDETIRLWNMDEQSSEPSLPQVATASFRLDFSPDGKQLVSLGQNGSILLWDVDAFQELGPEPIDYNAALLETLFDPDGKALILADKNGFLNTMDLTTFESQIERLPALQGQRISSLALSADARQVAYFRETQLPSTDDGGRAHGLALSEWDKYFDPAVNPGDIDFVVVQATNGLEPDYGFATFLESVKTIPIRGASHMFQPNQPWQEQADFFLSTVVDQGFHFYTLMIDWSSVSEVEGREIGRDVEQWLRYVEDRVDQKVLLHTSSYGFDNWLRPYGDWSKWPLFIIQYPIDPDRNGTPVLPAGVAEWKLWQYSADQNEAGPGYGVGGEDAALAVYNGTVTQMWEWLEVPVFTIYDRDSGAYIDPDGLASTTRQAQLAFSPDGEYVALGSEHNVSLWDAKLGNEISALPINGTTVTSIRFSPDGRVLGVGTERGTVLLWDLNLLYTDSGQGGYLDRACLLVRRDPRSFTPAELQQFFGDTTERATCSNPP